MEDVQKDGPSVQLFLSSAGTARESDVGGGDEFRIGQRQGGSTLSDFGTLDEFLDVFDALTSFPNDGKGLAPLPKVSPVLAGV